MNIFEVKQTMLDKGIPTEVTEQFAFPETKAGTPEEKIAFVNQMDSLLSREQILTVMQEQDDGTLSVSWGYEDKGKYVCICPRMKKLSQPATVFITFCGCCSGTIKHGFEQDLEVKLQFIETASSPLSSGGEKHCEHRYEIIENQKENYKNG